MLLPKHPDPKRYPCLKPGNRFGDILRAAEAERHAKRSSREAEAAAYAAELIAKIKALGVDR